MTFKFPAFNIHVSNYFSMFFDYFLKMLIPLLIIVLIGRLYSAEDFGRYAVATSFMSVLGLFLTFGVSNVISYEIASLNKSKSSLDGRVTEILKTGVIILLFFTVSGILFMFGILFFLDYSKEIKGIILALFGGYFFLAFNSVLCAVFIGLKEMKWIIPSTLGNLFSVFIFVLPLLFLRKPLYIIAIFWTLSQLSGVFISLLVLKKKKGLQAIPKTSHREIPRIMKRSLGVGLDNVIYRLGVNLSNIILPFYLVEAQIGIFNGAFKPFVLLIAGNQITIQVFLPYVASMMHRTKKEKEKILHIFHKINVFFTCTIILTPFFFPHLLNKIFFGNELKESIPYMFLLSLGYFLYYLPPYSAPLKALGREWRVIVSSVGQLLINFLAIILLVPKYGIKGAVYAVIIAFFGYWFLNIILYIREKLRPVLNIYSFFLFILVSFLNGYIVRFLLDQKIYSLIIFIAINMIGAYYILFSANEKKEVLSFFSSAGYEISP